MVLSLSLNGFKDIQFIENSSVNLYQSTYNPYFCINIEKWSFLHNLISYILYPIFYVIKNGMWFRILSKKFQQFLIFIIFFSSCFSINKSKWFFLFNITMVYYKIYLQMQRNCASSIFFLHLFLTVFVG